MPQDSSTAAGRQHGPRAIALVGPQGSGKSTLFEAMLAAAGSPVRRALDPRERAMGTELRLAHCAMQGDPFALLDCPGSVEFSHEADAALAVADLAVLVCEPAPARALALGPLFRQIEQLGLPALVFVNKIDTLGEAHVRDLLEALQAQSRRPLVLRQVPIREDGAIAGYVDLVSERAYRYRRGAPSEIIRMPATVEAREREARTQLAETLADHDDALLEKLLEDAVATPDDLYRVMHADLAQGTVDAVLLGAAERGAACAGCGRRCATIRPTSPRPSSAAIFPPPVIRWSRRSSAPATPDMAASSRWRASGTAASATVPCWTACGWAASRASPEARPRR